MPPSERQKKLESFAHILMGFGAGLVNLRLLLTLREWKQLPPENDKHPVQHWNGEEYWSAIRVIDILTDSREYDIGVTASWFVVLGVGVLIGRMIG